VKQKLFIIQGGVKTHPRWSIRAKLWISYLLVLAIPVFFMATIGYLWLKDSIERELQQRYKTYLNDVIQNVDEYFVQLESVRTQLARTTWITKIVNMQGDVLNRDRVNAWDVSEYQQFITACLYSIPAARFLGIYFPRKNFVIAPTATGTLEFLLHDAFTVKSLSKEAIDEILKGMKETQTVYRQAGEVYQYGKPGRGLVVLKSVLKLPDSPSTGAALISFIPDEELLRFMDMIRDSTEFVYVSVNSGDSLIFRDGEVSGKGSDVFTLTTASQVTGWNYELGISRSALLNSISSLRNFLFLIVAAILLVCLILSARFTTSLYRPVREILNLLSNNAVESGNELEQIKSNIADLKNRRDQLEEMAREHVPMLLSYYYSVLLLGGQRDAEKTAAELEKLGQRSYPLNRVCILITMTPGGVAFASRPAPAVQADFDKLGLSLDIFTISLSGRIVVIVRYEREEDFSLWLEGVHRTIMGSAMAAGNPVAAISDLPASYARANRDAGFRLAKSDLMIALRTGNRKDAGSMIRKILAAETSERGEILELEQLFRSVSDHVEPFPRQPSEAESWALRQADHICALRSGGAIDHTLLLEFVDYSIQNPGLSLQYVADKFNVSVSLVSKAFKDACGMGFNHYVNRRRLEAAKELLASGSDINTAAKMSGYGNDTTFRRLFKDFTGLTPSEYRLRGMSLGPESASGR
jgi:AraC-like DNA-binding protein/Tfp pilus assembly protein PilO